MDFKEPICPYWDSNCPSFGKWDAFQLSPEASDMILVVHDRLLAICTIKCHKLDTIPVPNWNQLLLQGLVVSFEQKLLMYLNITFFFIEFEFLYRSTIKISCYLVLWRFNRFLSHIWIFNSPEIYFPVSSRKVQFYFLPYGYPVPFIEMLFSHWSPMPFPS